MLWTKDGKQKICDCQKSMMGQDDKQMWMGQEDKQKSCDCEKPCDCQKPMMGQDDKQTWKGQDDKQKSCDCEKPCDCQKSMMGHDDKQKSCYGEDGRQIKSMMERCNYMTHKHVKSMMGDRKEDCDGGVKIVIINLRV